MSTFATYTTVTGRHEPRLRSARTRWRWPLTRGLTIELTCDRTLTARDIAVFRAQLDLAESAITGRVPARRAEPEPAVPPPDWPTVAPAGSARR